MSPAPAPESENANPESENANPSPVPADPRIEAAARRYHFATAPIGPSGVTEWEDVPIVRQIVCRTIASDILQAADLAAADAVLTPPDDLRAIADEDDEAAPSPAVLAQRMLKAAQEHLDAIEMYAEGLVSADALVKYEQIGWAAYLEQFAPGVITHGWCMSSTSDAVFTEPVFRKVERDD